MSLNQYEPGNVIRLTGTFTNSAGAAADPTTRTLVVQTPDGVEVSYTPTSTATGTWYYDYTIADDCTPGRLYYRFKGTGAVVAADENSFIVVPIYAGV